MWRFPIMIPNEHRPVALEGDAHMSPELTEELISQMAELKADSLTNRNICRAADVNEATLYRWFNKPSGRLHSALSDAQKGGEQIQVHPAYTIRKAVLH